MVLIAKDFNDADIEKAKKSKGEITLIRYIWFEDGLLLIHYLNNEPLELVEKGSSEKSLKVKPIIAIQQQPLRQTKTEGDILIIKNKKKGVIAVDENLKMEHS